MNNYKVSLKPYAINEFVEITREKQNFADMEKYTENVFTTFKNKLN